MIDSSRKVVFGAPMLPDPDRLAALTAEALKVGWLTNGGALHLKLEKALSAKEDKDRVASLVSSGTMALMLALGLGDLPQGAEVITTPLTFAATSQAIYWCGLKPVFADVDPVTLTLCPLAVRAAITARTAAILPVHFLGVPCDVHAISEVAQQHDLWLVYDAAHAFGVTFDDRPIGSFGDASAFSLHATKILHTGEGGYITTSRNQAANVRQMRNFGIKAGRAVGKGLNGKMSELNAAMGLSLLPDLPAELAARRALRKTYNGLFREISGIEIHGTRPGASESLGFYALRMPSALREKSYHALLQERIFARDHFPLLCGPDTFWPDSPVVTANGRSPVAPCVGSEIICLPFHGRITQTDATQIATIIAEAVEDRRRV